MACWRKDLKSMGQRMDAILSNDFPDISHDVTFIVGEEKVKISCHKLLLKAASPVFEAMFSERHSGQNVSGGSEIVHSNSTIKTLTKNRNNEISGIDGLGICIPDVLPVGLKNLIKYAYTHILNVDVKEALATMYASHKYDIKELAEHCGQVLQSKMNVDNVVILYQSALLFNDVELENNSWDYIQSNVGKLLESKQFLEFSEDNLCKLLKLDEMPTVASEVYVFRAVLKWGTNQCKNERKTISKDNVKRMLKNALALIRFPTMGHLEFFDIVEPSGMLSESECSKLYKYFLLSGERQLSVSKTLNYSFKKRNCLTFEFCCSAPNDTFDVANPYHLHDSFLVTGSTENLKLKAVGIVLPRTYADLPNVTIALREQRSSYYYSYTVARKKAVHSLEIFYIDFDTPVAISPDVDYAIYVNMDAEGDYVEPRVNFVQYASNLMGLPTRTWKTADQQQRTLTFNPYNYVIWALQFQN